MCTKQEYRQLAGEIMIRCEEWGELQMTAEKKREAERVRWELVQLCEGAKEGMSVEIPELLLALMDAYEVTRDEEMLQKVLDVVGEKLEQLEVSVESVKLLSYCYYYVEEEECADRAKEMLDVLRLQGDGKEVEMAEQVYRELVEEKVI